MKNNCLIFVPHQDDETNLVGNILTKKEIKDNLDIYVIYSSLDQNNKVTRLNEAINACKIYGIDKNNIIFLNYPDTPNRKGKHHFETDKSIIKDYEEIIIKYKPKYIFVTDFDFHSDHRMVSIAFDYAIKNVIDKENNYKPIVFKGFCYDCSYYGKKDYKASNLNKCVFEGNELSNRSYEWNKRISILNEEDNGYIWKKKAFKALKSHKSQYAVLHASSVINADNVFWLRRTDNLLNDAKVTTSEGDSNKLHDFVILDTKDIITINPNEIDYSKSSWIPENKKSIVTIEFKNKQHIEEIVLHGNVNEKENIAKITILIDGKEITKIEKLNSYGKATTIECVDDVYKIDFIIEKEYNNFGISEIEVFETNTKEYVRNIELINKVEKKERNVFINYINNVGYGIICFFTRLRRKYNHIKHKRRCNNEK